jgi:hypothetical protein
VQVGRWAGRQVGRLAALAFLAGLTVTLEGWGPQGHRLVAMVAANHLSPVARQNVRWLLGNDTLADVAAWADAYVADGHRETAPWHYVNIPADGTPYVSTRDCARGDCVVDRIRDNQNRLANRSLGRADRAMALKFVVHFVGDLHQPFHAIGVERGGNGIPIVAFGSRTCGRGGPERSCTLHGLWDSELIGHRRLRDGAYASELERQISAQRWRASGSPVDWAMESNALARASLLRAGGEAGEAYYQAHIAQIDQRLAMGGLRLARMLNDTLAEQP